MLSDERVGAHQWYVVRRVEQLVFRVNYKKTAEILNVCLLYIANYMNTMLISHEMNPIQCQIVDFSGRNV